ncbi:rCG39170 [Rattus norvegicus]|uniref:RCG39170 n=1 Tax=Rattus norvegicus TaxID=10116 RepID=A6KMK3_RAT|nr:rCG39170 [Rattus norvegicus]
MYASGAGGLV